MTKNQKILGGVLIVQVLLVVLVFLTGRPAPVNNEPLLTNFNADSVTKLSVEDNQGNQIVLEKQGDQWVMPEAGDYPAINETINDTLKKISEIQTDRLVTRTADSHQRLQVADDDFIRKINVTQDGRDFTIYLGSTPAPGSTHIRLSTDDKVYLTNAVNANQFSATASNWIDTSYVQLASDTIQSVSVKNQEGSLEFNKDADGNWQQANLPVGMVFNSTTFGSAISAISNLRMVAPAGTELMENYQLNNPQAKIVITYQDGENPEETIDLSIGGKDENGLNYYALSSNAAYVVKISAASAERWINLTDETYATPIPTSTPES